MKFKRINKSVRLGITIALLAGITLVGCVNEPAVPIEEPATEEVLVEDSVVVEETSITSGNTAMTTSVSQDPLGDPTNEVSFVVDLDGTVQAMDGSWVDGYTTDGINVYNEKGTKVGCISKTSTEDYVVSKYLNLSPEHLFEWYGWDWTAIDLGDLEFKEFEPYDLEYGYIKNGKEETTWTGCIGSDPGSIFVDSKTVWAYAFDSNVVEVRDNRAVTEKGTVYTLEYTGKKLTKISTTLDLGGVKYVVFYRLNDQKKTKTEQE